MGRVRAILTLLALGSSCFVPRTLHAAAVPVCCVCSGCPAAATICVLPPAGDTAPDSAGNGGAAGPVMSACDIACKGCASSQFVMQSCSDLLQCQQPVHAPATSHRVLLALGVGLAAYGVSAAQRARRRWRDRRFNSPAA